MKTPKTAKPYEWDWDGEALDWARMDDGQPSIVRSYANFETFSVGIFQWVPRKNGKGLKRAKAVSRLTGFINAPDDCFRAAREAVEKLNAQQRKVIKQHEIQY